MANGERRTANATACCMADGEMTPPPHLLSLSPTPLGGRKACPFCACFAVFRVVSLCCFLLLWLPTRRRHVWLPLDFRHDFLSRTSLLPPSPCPALPLSPTIPCLPFPYAICVLSVLFFLLPSLLAFFVLVGQKSTHELWHF